MNYEATIHVAQEKDGYYYVLAGWSRAIVGDKNNYFPIYRDMGNREAKAHAHLGIYQFPKSKNRHKTVEQAEAWAEQYKLYVRRVISMPPAFKVGHSCAWWA